jgi:hypothetical protein
VSGIGGVRSANAVDRADESVERLQRGLRVLDDTLARWDDLTVDCRYGELRRELLSQESKQQLLQEASSTNKASTTVTVCKSTGRLVRNQLGATDEGPLSRIASVLERPELLDRLSDEGLEPFQEASERLQRSLSAADAAAYYAANDFSAQTTFKRGEVPTAPNLDACRVEVEKARDSLAVVCKLLERA